MNQSTQFRTGLGIEIQVPFGSVGFGSCGAGSHSLTKLDLLPVMIWEARLLENPEGVLPSGQSWQGEKVT